MSARVTGTLIQYLTVGKKVRHAAAGDVLDESEIDAASLQNLKDLGFLASDPKPDTKTAK